MVLIFNSTVSREICGTNFTRVGLSGNKIARGVAECYFVATQPNTLENFPRISLLPTELHIHIYIYISDFHLLPLIVSRSLRSLAD